MFVTNDIINNWHIRYYDYCQIIKNRDSLYDYLIFSIIGSLSYLLLHSPIGFSSLSESLSCLLLHSLIGFSSLSERMMNVCSLSGRTLNNR